MKKVILAVLLLIGALLLGLGLPQAVILLQTRNAEQSEDAGITEVTLQVNSGLTHVEKLSILASDRCTLLNVGVARHQTPASLSQHSWALLETVMSDYGAPLLDASTTQQVEQFAMLVSEGDRSFQFWEVLFSDGYGNLLRLHLDDETGLPLAMTYYCADPSAPLEEWCTLSLYGLGDLCGLSPAGAMDKSTADTPQQIPLYYIPVTDGNATVTIKVQVINGSFFIGNQIG